MKVIIGMAVVAVLAALATNWLRDRGERLLHDSFDAALPTEESAHAWVPLVHGRQVFAGRVSFQDGAVTTVRCRSMLGTYAVQVNHHFSFQKSDTPVKAGCPGHQLQTALAAATRATVESHGRSERLVFTDDDDRTVVRLQGRGD